MNKMSMKREKIVGIIFYATVIPCMIFASITLIVVLAHIIPYGIVCD